MKIVDDTIIWAENESDLEERVSTILQRCGDNNITISRKKFELGSTIQFAGHIISDGGIRPDDEKFTALRNFKRPENIKELRSFLGLVLPRTLPASRATYGSYYRKILLGSGYRSTTWTSKRQSKL